MNIQNHEKGGGGVWCLYDQVVHLKLLIQVAYGFVVKVA